MEGHDSGYFEKDVEFDDDDEDDDDDDDDDDDNNE